MAAYRGRRRPPPDLDEEGIDHLFDAFTAGEPALGRGEFAAESLMEIEGEEASLLGDELRHPRHLHQAFEKDFHLQAADHARHTAAAGWPLAHFPSPRLARNTGGATAVNENGGWGEIHMAPGISASTRPNVEDRTGEPKEAVSLIDIQFSKSISGRLTMDFSKISAAVSDLASRCPDQGRAS